MRQETTTRTLYTFGELSDTAKERALEKGRESEGEFFSDSCEFVYDDFERICNILGIELKKHEVTLMGGGKRWDPNIWWSGFWSQGDGASFEGTYQYARRGHRKIRGYAPQDAELHRIADALLTLQKKFGYGLTATITARDHGSWNMQVTVDYAGTHEKIAEKYAQEWEKVDDELTELLRDLANWLYRTLQKEYEYRTSDEQVIESFEANQVEFTEDGKFAGHRID